MPKAKAHPSLNSEQQAVVDHYRGPLRVSACAGAGKTTALIERVAHLVQHRHVSPSRILMISFSRAAREEMQVRIDKRLPGVNAGKCARTFHSIGLMIFQKEIDPDRQWTLDTSGYLFKRAAETAYKHLALVPESKAIVRLAELAKNNMIGTRQALKQPTERLDKRLVTLAEKAAEEADVDPFDLLQVYLKTESIRTGPGVRIKDKLTRFVTYNDMLFEAAQLLQQPKVRERWANTWDFVLQDEAQDCNETQAAIAEALAHKHRNYMIVGDPAQSVYGFRGAQPEKMVEFDRRWPGARTIVMHRNYRSGIEIVEVANRLLGQMPASTVVTDEYGDVTPMASERNTRSHVTCHVFEDPTEEAEAVAANVLHHQREGVPFSEQAVLVRLNRLTRDVEIALATKAIPYRLISGQSFFNMREAKALFSYLQVISCRADTDAFTACISNPSRMLGKAFVAAVSEAHDMVRKDWLTTVEKATPKLSGHHKRHAIEWMSLMRRLEKMMKGGATPFEILERVELETKLREHLLGNSQDEEDSNVSENISELLSFVKRFDTVNALLTVIENVERHRNANARTRNAVTVSTVHKAKGGEWGTVYVVQLAERLFPHARAALSEERRCFYVACTRAKDELWLSLSRLGSSGEKMDESSFLAEAEIALEDGERHETGTRVVPARIGTQTELALS